MEKTKAEEILNDGTWMDAIFLDASAMSIKVRRIPALKMSVLQRCVGDEARELACYLDKPEAFVLTLTDESAVKLLTEGRRLNFPNLEGFLKRQADLAKLFQETSDEDTKGVVREAVAAAMKGQT